MFGVPGISKARRNPEMRSELVAHPPPSTSANDSDVKEERPRIMSGHHGQRVTKRPVEFKFDMITTPSPPQGNQYSQFQRGGRSQQQQQHCQRHTSFGRKLVDPYAQNGRGGGAGYRTYRQ